MDNFSRYARQMILPELGTIGQTRLAQSRVLCVGAGGLGSPALLYMAAAGVGHIGIIDPDQVDESNLQRQILFSQNDVGQYKAGTAAARIHAINPLISCTAYTHRLTTHNCESLLADYDIIIDGADNFETSFLINDTCVKLSKPWVYASILGFSGQLAVFNGGACFRCLFPQRPPQSVMNCAEAGILGPVAGVLGSMQALEVIKLAAGISPMKGLLTIDFKTMRHNVISLARDPSCPVCSCNKKEIIIMSDEISVTEAKAHIASGCVLIDVREQNEWDAGHIEGARLVPLSTLTAGAILDLNKDTPIVLHCKAGRRSLSALQILRAQGFTNLLSMAGGYDAWIMACEVAA
jgi:adenylyltransferase/sulfurtransferase